MSRTMETHCPKCGYSPTTPGPKIPAIPSTLAPEDEAAFIRSEVQRLDKERTALLQRLNSVQSHTRRLPPETLSQIFLYTCPPVDFYASERTDSEFTPRVNESVAAQLTLGAVSVYWRSVAWSTPQLWTSIDQIFSDNVDTAESPCDLLSLFLDNSGCLPLNISLKFTYDDMTNNDDVTTDGYVYFLLHPHLHRVARLWLYSPPLEWFLWAPKHSQLTELHIFDPPYNIDLADSISIHRVSLAQTTSINIKLCWSSITTLDLRELDAGTGTKLLVQCPNLISYHLTNVRDCDDCDSLEEETDVEKWLSQPITLQYLRDFSWTYDSLCSWSTTLIQNLSLPALRSLRWTNLYDNTQISPNFFQHFSSTLETLDLVDSGTDNTKVMFRHFLGAETPIKNLKFTRPTADFAKGIVKDLLALRVTRTTIVKKILFLRDIHVFHPQRGIMGFTPCVIMKLLDERLDESNPMFRLDFNDIWEWTSEDWKAVQEMVDSGFHEDTYYKDPKTVISLARTE